MKEIKGLGIRGIRSLKQFVTCAKDEYEKSIAPY